MPVIKQRKVTYKNMWQRSNGTGKGQRREVNAAVRETSPYSIPLSEAHSAAKIEAPSTVPLSLTITPSSVAALEKITTQESVSETSRRHVKNRDWILELHARWLPLNWLNLDPTSVQ